MKKISVIVNKNWETEGVMASLVNVGLKASGLSFPDTLYTPAYNEKPNPPRPRAVFSFKNGKKTTTKIKVWCIQDIMYFDGKIAPSMQSSSSSEEKFRVLPDVIKADNPDLIISVSTAGYPSDFSCNGSVVVGGNFFVHDTYPRKPFNSLSNFKHKDFGKVLHNNANEKIFGLINNDFKNIVEPKFLKTPRNPCDYPCCIASSVFTALSVVNVTDYTEYNWFDHEALAQYKETEKRLPCNSTETTHGVVKLCTDKPIIFVSPITDQFGHFDFEVTPTQNFAASFNAGVVVGQLLCSLNEFGVNNKFSK